MATRTVYTSTIAVPVYASWKCEHCGEINFSAGVIGCRRSASASGMSNARYKEAEAKAEKQVQEEWTEHAYKIMSDPNHNAQILRNDLTLQNVQCTKCGQKPRWYKGMRYMWTTFCILPAIITGIMAFNEGINTLWLILCLVFAGIFLSGIINEHSFKIMMKNLPKEYTPVMGSQNAELIEYAKGIGKTIPSPEETIAYIHKYEKPIKKKVQTSIKNEGVSGVVEINENHTSIKSGFCRKCGTALRSEEDFCHKCGTKRIKKD